MKTLFQVAITASVHPEMRQKAYDMLGGHETWWKRCQQLAELLPKQQEQIAE